MRKLILVLIVVAFFASCNNGTQDPKEPGNPQTSISQKHKNIT